VPDRPVDFSGRLIGHWTIVAVRRISRVRLARPIGGPPQGSADATRWRKRSGSIGPSPSQALTAGPPSRASSGRLNASGRAVRCTIAAAEAVDRKAESLPETWVEAIVAVRPQALRRAFHRRAHLDTIERVLAR